MRAFFETMRRLADRDGAAPAIDDGARRLTRRSYFDAVATLAAELRGGEGAVGIFAENGVDWAVAQLAGAMAGRRVAPLPGFFSDAQLAHVMRDAGVGVILADAAGAARAAAGGAPVRPLTPQSAAFPAEPAPGFEQIIYTSGSTGQPKGVRLGADRIAWSADALAKASSAGPEDRYLSVLPLPLLLETICAVFSPALVGGAVRFDPALSGAVARGEAAGLAGCFAEARPTMSVLLPELLKALVAELGAAGAMAPETLRFVAVGGAAVSADLADAAWALGVPAHEGYGLSECCSVVAVNRAGDRRAGAVGRPLAGLTVTVEEGEIVVEGPSVMNGYLGGDDIGGRWRTGDLGALDEDGRLTVHGRKDNMIVTGFGRNISPEWVETMILGDPRIARAVVVGRGAPHLSALVIPSRYGADWFAAAAPEDGQALVAGLCASAPDYATPRATMVLTPEIAVQAGLLTPNGRFRRAEAEAFVAASAAKAPPSKTAKVKNMSFYETLLAETAAEREAFTAIPLVRHALINGASQDLYRRFLIEAYHHVKHTFPLLALAASRTRDERYQDALVEYMEEERGHEKWILDDIAAMGGDVEAVRNGQPGTACRVMVAFSYDAINRVSPYAMLGSVHVLEGLSVTFADILANAMKSKLGLDSDKGFSYLRSHGALDQEHVAFFRILVDGITDPEAQHIVIDHAKVFYRLYGDIFRDLAAAQEMSHAA